MKDPQIQHPLKDSYNNSDQQNSTDEESESSEVREAIQTRYDTSRRMEKKREQLEEREREASKSRIGCKTFILLVILVIVLLCAYISVQKPPQVLEPLKTRINDSYGSEIPVYEGGQEIAFEGTKLVLNEDQLYSFINGISETKVRIDRVELEQDTIIIMKNLATEGSPLWFAVEITNVSNEGMQSYELKKVGFGSIELPESVLETISEKIYGISFDLESQNEGTQILSSIIGSEYIALLDPENVVIREGELELAIQGGEDFPEIDMDEINKFIQEYIQ